MVLTGFPAAYSSARARGTAGVVHGVGAAGAGVVVGAVVGAGVDAASMAGAASMAAVASTVDADSRADVDSPVAASPAVASRADMGSPVAEASMAEADFTVAAVSTVVEAATVVVDTGNRWRRPLRFEAGRRKTAGSAVLLAVFVFAAARFLARMSGFVETDRSKIAAYSPGDRYCHDLCNRRALHQYQGYGLRGCVSGGLHSS